MPKEIFQTAYPLAQNGSSNFGICLQLETALKYSAGFVLLNTTSVDRLDIPFSNNDDHLLERPLNVFNTYHNNNKILRVPLTAEEEQPHIVSNSITSMLTNKKFAAHQHWSFNSDHACETDARFEAMKTYIKYLYNPRIKRQMDVYMISAALHNLHLNNIPFVIMLDSLGLFRNCKWLEPKHMCVDLDAWRIKALTPINQDPGYHTYPHMQKEAAEILYKHISRYWDLG
jgi:uncharacterized protein YifN (PemK superfamily)